VCYCYCYCYCTEVTDMKIDMQVQKKINNSKVCEFKTNGETKKEQNISTV